MKNEIKNGDFVRVGVNANYGHYLAGKKNSIK